jgi:hypothetical protein
MTTTYQPLDSPGGVSKAARVNGLPLISRQDLDNLADELLRHPLDATVEEVFLIARHRYSWSTMLFTTPNRATDSRRDFVVYEQDAQWLQERHFDLLGYVHTHREEIGNHRPSQADLDGIPVGYVGAVYMHGHDNVYWYGMGKVFHTTSVLRPALMRQAKEPIL